MQNVDKFLFTTLDDLNIKLNLQDSDTVASACSGGPDSLFLTLLLNIWCVKKDINLLALIVDHQLRTNSFLEAQKTKKLLSQYNINSIIITLKNIKNSQQHARIARYNALFDVCHKKSIKYIFFGHHLNDQIETFFLRLMRKSGPYGLCGMQTIVERENFFLIRPLLSVTKESIQSFLDSKGIIYIQDPSNKSYNYMRTRIRYMWNVQKCIDDSAILTCMQKIKKMTEVVDDNVHTFIQQCSISKLSISFISEKFLCLPVFVQEKVLHYIICHLSPRVYPLRDSKIMRLREAIISQKRIICGGCDFRVDKTVTVTLNRERNRINGSVANQKDSSYIIN